MKLSPFFWECFKCSETIDYYFGGSNFLLAYSEVEADPTFRNMFVLLTSLSTYLFYSSYIIIHTAVVVSVYLA